MQQTGLAGQLSGASGRNQSNPRQFQTLDAAMQAEKESNAAASNYEKATDAQSVVESYKRRSVTQNLVNPLQHTAEMFVNIPVREKPAPIRQPFVNSNSDLIVNGVGEDQRGMPRNSKVLVGHNSTELKQQILGHFTKHNLE